MPIHAFGELSLLLAFFNIFCLLAPAGLDQIAVRYRIAASIKLLGITFVLGGGLGVVAGVVVHMLGALSGWLAVALGCSIWIGGLVVTASGLVRATGRLAAATWVFTGGNWGLLAVGLAGQWLAMPTAGLPFGLFVVGQSLIAIVAWAALLRGRTTDSSSAMIIPWREAAALLGMAAVATIALQLERLILPPLLGLTALATFTVLASVAIFPFRIVTSGFEFSFTPRLRNETNPARRRALFRRELVMIAIVLLGATAAVLAIAPWIVSWITVAKYQLPLPLLLAACVNGAVKFLQTIPRSVLTACGSADDLALLNLTGWMGLALGIIGGVIASPAGLIGVILGLSFGMIIGNAPAFFRMRNVLR
jgi:hypothetical protein